MNKTHDAKEMSNKSLSLSLILCLHLLSVLSNLADPVLDFPERSGCQMFWVKIMKFKKGAWAGTEDEEGAHTFTFIND